MAEDVAIRLYNLLNNKGVYEKVSEVDVNIFEKFISKDGFSTLDLYCPNCKEKFTLETDKTTITCSHCGLQVKLDNRYGLSGVEFKNIAEWYEWQKEQLRKELKSKNYCLESKVELRHLSKDGKSLTRPSGFGLCRLDKTGLTYNGTEDGKEIEKFFPIDCIYRLLFGAGEDFEIYEGKELYYFIPEEKRSAVVWYIVSELLKEN